MGAACCERTSPDRLRPLDQPRAQPCSTRPLLASPRKPSVLEVFGAAAAAAARQPCCTRSAAASGGVDGLSARTRTSGTWRLTLTDHRLDEHRVVAPG
jgi:hypothetical protein